MKNIFMRINITYLFNTNKNVFDAFSAFSEKSMNKTAFF